MWTWTLWVVPLFCKFILAAPPAKPENISCVFYYDKNMTCTWSPEKESNETSYTVYMTYSFGKSTGICNASNSASCSFPRRYVLPPDNCSIEVEVQNRDGKIKSDITYWFLDDIGKWSVRKGTSRPLSESHWMEVNFQSAGFAYNLTGLRAFTEYVLALRCRTIESSFWSNWSEEKTGMTEEEVPCGLDLWRILSAAEEDGRRTVWLLWKKAREAPVLEKTLGYNIRYFPENNTNLTETRNTTTQHLELHLGGETYWVYVASYNALGKSPEAELRIPAVQEQPFRCIEAMQAYHAQDLLVVAWQSSAPDVDSWMVEWLPDLASELSVISWESVSRVRNWTIHQDKLKPFVCYNISVYPVVQDKMGEPYSIQAYAKEAAPSEGPVSKVESIGVKTVTVTWKEIPKSLRNGFVSNYTIFYQAERGREFAKTVNSSILQCDLESLTRQTSYTVQVMASTRAGGTNGTKINFKTLSISIFEIILITSLVGGGLFLLTILTVTYGLKKPNQLTHLCCPTVPNPAESSIATWRREDFKDKSRMKESDDSGNTEDSILKPCSVSADLIDKLVVTFENFLEEVSIEEARKGQGNILGGEANEYVMSPSRPGCPHPENFEEPLVLTEISSGEPYHQCFGMPDQTCSEAEECGEGSGPKHLREEGVLKPYLKNSLTTRLFLVHEDHTKREV
uniref:Interleukin-31 receptor subunit alpha n=1 Tax=Jaculus jaculus TaxID=51337 RepID=A0A8C5NZ02_JACJA